MRTRLASPIMSSSGAKPSGEGSNHAAAWRTTSIAWRSFMIGAPGADVLRVILEQLPHLLVGGLREIAIPQADSRERFRRARADSVVGDVLELVAGRRCADRHGDDDSGRPQRAYGLHRRTHRRAGGQSVVDEDRRAAAQIDERPAAAVFALATLQFGELLACDRLDG